MPLFTLLDTRRNERQISCAGNKTYELEKATECTLPKLSNVCLVIRYLKHYSTIETLKILYHAYLHSAMAYGIILGGNSIDSNKLFFSQREM